MHRVGPALCAATVAGGLLALQSRVNGALTERVGSAVVVALSSFLIGLVTLLVVVAATGKWRLVADVRRRKARTPLIFTGGLGGAVIVTTAASAVPLIGVALLGVCLVAGQLAGSLVVDGVGVGPSGRHPITAPRVLGSTLAVAGVALSLVGERVELRPLVVAMVVLAGVVGAVQQAVNGRLQQHLRDTWLTATVNFAVGTAAVALVALVVVGRGVDLGSWPVNPLLYVGGRAAWSSWR
jgi:transporter family-2 protein